MTDIDIEAELDEALAQYLITSQLHHLVDWGRSLVRRAEIAGHEQGMRDADDAQGGLPDWTGNSDRSYAARVALARKSRAIRALLPDAQEEGGANP